MELLLRAQPEVSDCAILASENAGENELVAFLANGTGHTPDSTKLRARLAEKLPEYMLPARFVWLEELPRNNGKIDRRALRDLARGQELSANYLAPRNELERQLADIWQLVLHREKIGVRDNFFELGGHSLGAGLIATAIEQELGRSLPLSTLFWASTIESLAQQLVPNESSTPRPSLVPLQTEGEGAPLYLAHGWGGDVQFFQELARLLPQESIYGLQAQGLDGKAARHITVEEMAAHYLCEIRAFQPRGPYRLVGYSLGSLIAFEMARQLRVSGERVSLLALLDPPPRPAPALAYWRTLAPVLWPRARHHLGRWVRSGGRESIHLKRRWKSLRQWAQKNRARLPVIRRPFPPSLAPPSIAGFRDYYSAVAYPYRLRSYPGFIEVIASETAPKIFLRLWENLAADGARIQSIACTHCQMIERDFLPLIADALKVALKRARASD